ncbi:PepSY domain-containing protein [Candidatus Nitrosotalea bavarica]|uniref:PepSY domain-containing protein n=1 Tax=Candidatus Nitrosotalea bavarica TaxID=1903277 RepID=UPI000C707CCE|nr:PepSY domain-containing protein [Candidatus Nitrosotalea bavarica]
MNTSSLSAHKKMLAIIIGVAIFATAGMGAASAQSAPATTSTAPKIQGSINIEQLLLSNVKVDFSTAATTAAGGSSTAPIIGGKVISGSLKPMQGSLVYAFKVIDGNNMVYSVIVDPSSGSVLYASAGHAFQMGGFGGGHAGGMNGGFKHGGQGWNKQTPSTSTAPSGTTS